jgi:carboxylesterase type B
VQTSSGPVSGHPASVNTDVSEYLGIPFAVPPVGNLRWQPPQLYNGTAPINGTDYVRDSLLFNSPRIMEALPYIHNFCSTEGLHLQVWI